MREPRSAGFVGHLTVEADDLALRMEAQDEVAVLPPEAQDALHGTRVARADDDLGLGAGVAPQLDPHRALLHGEATGHERLAPPGLDLDAGRSLLVELGDGDRAVLLHRNVCDVRSEEHTSELQSLMRISYAVFCLKKKKHKSSKR